MRKTLTAKNTKKFIVGFYLKKDLERGLFLQDCRRQSVDKVNSSGEGLWPVRFRDRGLSKEGKPKFDNMSMLPLNNTILLRGVRAGNSVNDAIFIKKV